jgi:hypothetical protein
LATKKRKKKFPFKRGQKVRYKNQKTNEYGFIWSDGPAKIGDPRTCKIPGGPLVLEGYVYVRWLINGKKHICIEAIDKLEPFKRT